MTLRQILKAVVRPINLLQPNYKYELFVGICHNDDLKVQIPDLKDQQEAKKICNYFLQCAHIVAMKYGLRMIMDEPKGSKP